MKLKVPDFPHSHLVFTVAGARRHSDQYGGRMTTSTKAIPHRVDQHYWIQVVKDGYELYNNEPIGRHFEDMDIVWHPTDQIDTIDQVLWEAWFLETIQVNVDAALYRTRTTQLLKLAHKFAPLQYVYQPQQNVLVPVALAAKTGINAYRNAPAIVKEVLPDDRLKIESHGREFTLHRSLVLPSPVVLGETDKPVDIIRCYQLAHMNQFQFHPLIMGFAGHAFRSLQAA